PAPPWAATFAEGNETGAAAPDGPLPALFARQAARTPGDVALVCGGDRLTYAELNERANRLAHELIARGVGPEDRVALVLPRTPAIVVAILAVLTARPEERRVGHERTRTATA